MCMHLGGSACCAARTPMMTGNPSVRPVSMLAGVDAVDTNRSEDSSTAPGSSIERTGSGDSPDAPGLTWTPTTDDGFGTVDLTDLQLPPAPTSPECGGPAPPASPSPPTPPSPAPCVPCEHVFVSEVRPWPTKPATACVQTP